MMEQYSKFDGVKTTTYRCTKQISEHETVFTWCPFIVQSTIKIVLMMAVCTLFSSQINEILTQAHCSFISTQTMFLKLVSKNQVGSLANVKKSYMFLQHASSKIQCGST